MVVSPNPISFWSIFFTLSDCALLFNIILPQVWIGQGLAFRAGKNTIGKSKINKTVKYNTGTLV